MHFYVRDFAQLLILIYVLFNNQLFIQYSTFYFIFNFLEPSFLLVSEKRFARINDKS